MTTNVLHEEGRAGVNISSAAEIANYTFDGGSYRTTLWRVELSNIVGGQDYILIAKIGGDEFAPRSLTRVEAGNTTAVMQCRHFIIKPGDVLTLELIGNPSDTNITVVTRLIDATPITLSEIYGGGDVLVDHNYGGDDVLRYRQANGQGIDNAIIQVFLASEYNAGKRVPLVETRTNVNGRWVRPVMLDPGEYMLLYYKQGDFGPDEHLLTVEA